ncbi:MAG: hypothetical protein Q8K21_02125 [Hydrogenophaga sp.]|uniref:hypothetical protein n=1 Tax=Hydrogenophaga sp. TaxID=1904254 RepID=UPI00273062B6|nr:hypothetical protein [Hydrogenophaga sp.]MDP2163017.1 hypothetical protein [Hydrogenophaga sp.]
MFGYARISLVKFFLHLLNPRGLLAGGLGLCAAVGALAISLGPNTHSAVLGQPLDLSVKTMLDKGDDPNALCLDASVFYVDRQLDKSQVRVTAEKSANLQESVIRIRADAPVEGTVVTVHLRAGCAQQTSRRYVVLAAAPRPTGGEGTATQLMAAPPAQNNAARNQQQERELQQLREELVKAQTALAENRQQLQSVQSQGFRKELVVGVVGLLCLTFAGLLFLLRQRPPEPALTGSGPGLLPESTVGSGPGSELGIRESLFGELKRGSAPSSRPLPDAIPPLAKRDRAKFSVSVPFVPRTVRVPEIFDLQQQVEFFSSLGQQDRAISLLRKHLVENVKTSALVYLDLLDLYHQTGDREEYEVLRADFNRVFNTRIASFDDYTTVGSNVSAYEDVLARIEAVWPKRRVFDIIDNALFREPGNPAEVLDLEAYRELLLLHAVVREIIDLQADPTDSGNTLWPDLAMQPRSSPRLGLDIDLSEFVASDKPVTAPGVRARAPASSSATRSGKEPTVFDSLVDFDDYDTGFRPDGLGKS